MFGGLLRVAIPLDQGLRDARVVALGRSPQGGKPLGECHRSGVAPFQISPSECWPLGHWRYLEDALGYCVPLG